ncbi:MAG: 3'-5' exonuclease [Saprospiraceae bacterium]|nr:3'-5' exonuclease [Saprospiraceae bacterium]
MSNWFTNRNGKNPAIPQWKAYEALSFSRKRQKKRPIEATRFVVFDTETTGLNYQQDRILSIGAVSVINGQIDLSNTFEKFLIQDFAPAPESIPIHGILPQTILAGSSEAETLGAFLDYVGDSILVGHHVGFDLAITNVALQRHGCGKLRNQNLDTKMLALRVEHVLKTSFYRPDDYTLDALCMRFKLTPSDRHTASGDAYLTALLLLKLLYRLKLREVHTLGALLGS